MATTPVDLARMKRASKRAADLGITPGHMRRLIREGTVEAEMIRGFWYISDDAWTAYLASGDHQEEAS